MEFYTRELKKTDVEKVNKLYQIISGRSRTSNQYNWEWINTWDGMGSSWLMFDPSRKKDDQLICQYSLIPTPFSFFGKECNAGKTENCMSHPDFRGKRIYFPHEKKYFEEAKKKFDIFFTTAGQGAPGKVRRKLGYNALDYWIEYTFFTNRKSIYNHLTPRKINSTKTKTFAYILSYYHYLRKFISTFTSHKAIKKDYYFSVFDSNNSPLDEISAFWKKNRNFYHITIDRKKEYLSWRIDENPYFDYKYLVLYNKETIIGYIIYRKKESKYIIEDLVVENRSNILFNLLFEELIKITEKENITTIVCMTLKGNTILKNAFSKSRFIKLDFTLLSKIKNKSINKNIELKPFHTFIKPELDIFNKGLDPKNWYITSLFTEGIV